MDDDSGFDLSDARSGVVGRLWAVRSALAAALEAAEDAIVPPGWDD